MRHIFYVYFTAILSQIPTWSQMSNIRFFKIYALRCKIYIKYVRFVAALFSLCKRQTPHAMRCKWFLIINSCFTVIRYTCQFISGISQWDRVTFREVHMQHWFCTLTLYILIKSLCGLCMCVCDHLNKLAMQRSRLTGNHRRNTLFLFII